MKTIYIDAEFRCRLENDGTMRAVETDSFDGKCDTYIEGYRLVPAGETWTREDGVTFTGEMVAPWKDFDELDAAQRAFEREELKRLREDNADMGSALELLGYSEEVSTDG